MERLLFSFHKTINTAYHVVACFSRGSPTFPGDTKKQYIPVLHLTYAPVQTLYALLSIIIFHVIS